MSVNLNCYENLDIRVTIDKTDEGSVDFRSKPKEARWSDPDAITLYAKGLSVDGMIDFCDIIGTIVGTEAKEAVIALIRS